MISLDKLNIDNNSNKLEMLGAIVRVTGNKYSVGRIKDVLYIVGKERIVNLKKITDMLMENGKS